MVAVVRTDEFDEWITKLKDKASRLGILKRIDRLANGILVTTRRLATACRNSALMSARATGRITSKSATC